MPIDEKKLRETRDELIGGIADVHRKAGALPDARAAEKLVDPILNKVDQTADDKRRAPAPKPKNRTVREGEWYGEADHSPQIGVEGKSRVAAALPGESMRLESKVLGEYAIRGNRVVPLDGAPDGKRREAPFAEFMRWVTRQLWHHPDFKRRLSDVAMSNMTPDQKDKAYRRIFSDAYRLFGDPRTTWLGAPEPKIVVGGK